VITSVKKVRLKTSNLLKRFARYFGRDMSESVTYFIDIKTGKPIENRINPDTSIFVSSFHVLQHGEEFLVVDHPNPISKDEYEKMKELFSESPSDTVNERGSFKGVF
jgi:hypothetical protein